MDGIKYPFTGAGLQQAINDAMAFNTGSPNVAAGALVIVPKAFAIGSTTITVGSTGTAGQQTDGKPVSLWFAAFGTWNCSGNPCFELASRLRVWGMGRFTQINNTGASPTFRITSPAENVEILDLWLQGGLNAIKTRATGTSVDVPGLIIRRNFLQGQTGNAIELVTLADTSEITSNFITTPGNDCLRIGVLDNGASGGGTSENSVIANNFCQNYGNGGVSGKGFHFEPSAFTTAWQAVGWIIDGNQIGPAGSGGTDAFFYKGGGDNVDIRNTTFVSPVGTATSDAMHLEVFAGGVGHSNIRVSGVHFGGGNARYAIFWDELAPTAVATNVLERVSVGNGLAAGIFARGDIRISDVQQATTVAGSSSFQAAGAFKGENPFAIKNSLDAPLTVTIDSGSTAAQNNSLRFSDRGTRIWDVQTFGINPGDFCITNPTTGCVLNFPSAGNNGTVFGSWTIRAGTSFGGTFTHSNTANQTYTFPNQTATVALDISATTGSLGGTSLAAGACTSGTTTATGASTSMAVVATPNADPGASFFWTAFVSSSNTVTVRICNFTSAAATPTATTYSVRVMQ